LGRNKRKAAEAELEDGNERGTRVKLESEIDETGSNTEENLNDTTSTVVVPQRLPTVSFSQTFPPSQNFLPLSSNPSTLPPPPLGTFYPLQPGFDAYYYQNPAFYPNGAETGVVPTATPTKTSKKVKAADTPRTRKFCRKAAGQVWEDDTLANWPKDDFRIFAGNLGNDVTDDSLKLAFSKYKSCSMARVVRDKRTGKSKGYGFVSFLDPHDFVRALKEMNGKYICNRPCKLMKSRWKDRNCDPAEKPKTH